METINVGVVGLGNMGSTHAKQIFEGMVPGLKLKCVCDNTKERLNKAEEVFKDEVSYFSDYDEMLSKGDLSGVIIATPHFLHPPMSIKALKAGKHVLCEKPAGVDAKDVEELNRVAEASGKTFAMMFNQRTNPLFIRLKEIVDKGKLGEVKRFVWIINNWYRTQYYYDSGDWRGTWNGEGGGVLLNQCPHNLDIWQWIMGTPAYVTAYCHEGRYHDITVEDDVTIYAEYEDGASASFITSTGELPGTNRLEISGTQGKAVVENGKLTTYLLETDERTVCRKSGESFYVPRIFMTEYLDTETEDGHTLILKNFAENILYGTPLIAPGTEGIKELTISNAAYLSAWEKRTVALPIDGEAFTKGLRRKQAEEKQFYKKCDRHDIPSFSSDYEERWSVRW